MSKNRLLSGKKKKLTGADLSAERYDYLDISNAEPDLGLPTVDNSILKGDLDGSRTWIDIADYAEEFKGFTGSAGTSGSDGSSGSDGLTGFVGSQGDVGYTGSKGEQGSFGGASFEFLYSTDITGTDPLSGEIEFNTLTFSGSTTVAYINFNDKLGESIYAYLQTIDDSTSQIKGHFSIAEKADPSNFALFAITGSHTEEGIPSANHFHIPVSYLSGTATFTDGMTVVVTFARTGDRGDTGFVGSRGDLGYTGSQGAGYTGSQGAGFAGSRGDLGFTGSRGSVGFTGSGAAGSNGTDGAVGFTGSKGDQGIQGFTGSSGSGSGGTTVLERHYRKTGTLTVSVGSEKWYVPLDSTIIGIIARVETAPNGTSSGIQIGVNVTNTAGDKTAVATLNINNLYKASNVFSTPLTVLSDKFVTVDILSVGTTTAGADLTVTFTYTRI